MAYDLRPTYLPTYDLPQFKLISEAEQLVFELKGLLMEIC